MQCEQCYRQWRKEGRWAAGMASGGGGCGVRCQRCRSGGVRARGGGRSRGKRSSTGGSSMQSE